MLKRQLSNTKLLPKILSMGIVLTVCFVLILGYVYVRFRESKWQAKRDQTRNLVLAAHEAAERYVDLAGEGAMREDEAKSAAMAAVKSLRYENDNYFWINDLEPKMIMHPNYSVEDKPGWYATDGLVDYADPTGKRLFVEFVRVCEEHGQGFVDYRWAKPGREDQEPVPKVSYVKLLRIGGGSSGQASTRMTCKPRLPTSGTPFWGLESGSLDWWFSYPSSWLVPSAIRYG